MVTMGTRRVFRGVSRLTSYGDIPPSARGRADGLLQAVRSELLGVELLAVHEDGRRTGHAPVVGGLRHAVEPAAVRVVLHGLLERPVPDAQLLAQLDQL